MYINMYLAATRDCFVLHDFMFGPLFSYPIKWDNKIERLLPENNECKLFPVKLSCIFLLIEGVSTLGFILFWQLVDFDPQRKIGVSFLTVTAMLGVCSIPAGAEGLVFHWSRQDLTCAYNRLYKLTQRVQFHYREFILLS